MIFTENRYDRSMEKMMKGIPNFYPRGSGIVVTGKPVKQQENEPAPTGFLRGAAYHGGDDHAE